MSLLAVGLTLSFGLSGSIGVPVLNVRAIGGSDDPVPSVQAVNEPLSNCNTDALGDTNDTARSDPEWVPVNQSAAHPFPLDEPTILEGAVATPAQVFGVDANGNVMENSTSQAPSEVAEEDLPWSHYTHDKTIDVIPDTGYKHLLSTYLTTSGAFVTRDRMEVEWDNASSMVESNGESDQTWGAEPTFVWPSVGDRVWVSGRWIFDCGHTGLNENDPCPTGVTCVDPSLVRYDTEIHPPRVAATFRLNHTVVPGSTLPITGPLTKVPVTEADVFASGNGGGANDYCSLINRHINAVDGLFSGGITGVDDCTHTGPIIPINDRNYVMDIYPPGTDYSQKLPNGTFPVNPVSRDGSGNDLSLQWRTVDQSGQIPAHSGSSHLTGALYCLVDASTPAPTQGETGCPVQPAHPTRLRLILPFAGTSFDSFAQSILLGWDDVPAAPVSPVRNFSIALHEFRVLHNGESGLHHGDWRVFVDVGGQWKYVTGLPSDGNQTDSCNHHGVFTDDPLTGNSDGSCYRYDGQPWTVSIQDGPPIHVAVGGYESDSVDSDFCQNSDLSGGCDPGVGSGIDLATANDDRVGTYEFDVTGPGDYSFTTQRLNEVPGGDSGVDGTQYSADFTVAEIPSPAPPISAPLAVGIPSYLNSATGETFVTSATPLTLSTATTGTVGFQYRYRKVGTPLPTFASGQPFPVHWTNTIFRAGPLSVPVSINAYDGSDGPYVLQYSAENGGGLLEPRRLSKLTLDNSPPVITISQPQPAPYPHSGVLTLNYTVDDGSGSGVAGISPTLDGSSSLSGHGLLSGQVINLLTELSLGTHTFTVSALDNLGNRATVSVTFTVIVTPESIKGDVTQFLASGAINKAGIATSLLAKLDAAAAARGRGECGTSANQYQAFINEITAQIGKGIDPAAAAIMIDDARYLMAHCP
jgi:hypothetical protein